MADDNGAPDGGGDNPNTPEQLRIARADAKAAREDATRYRGELATLRGEMTRTKTSLEAEIETLKTSHATELERTKIDLTGRATAAESEAKAAKEAAQKRVMMSDLSAAARDAGLRDMDGLKLLDMSGAKLDADGNLTNAADMLTAMKETKPYFFGAAPGTTTGTSSSTATPPAPGKPSTFNARTATKEERSARLAELTGPSRLPIP